ncbi:MAG: hypothetical protein AB8G15_01460 [Saprospiraceae bacterium]
MICAQKTQLLSYIEEHIATLELRIQLNGESVVPLETISVAVACQSQFDFQQMEIALLRNEEATKVIVECQVAINKLYLLKKFLPLLELEYLLSLFTHYDQWDLKEILARLKQLAC